MDLIGKIIDREERADHIQNYIDGTINDLNYMTDDISSTEKPTCYVGGIGFRGAKGISSTEPDYSPFGFLNADNVASEVDKEHASIDPEQIIEWDPEVLFVDEGGYSLVLEDLNNNSAFSTMEAIKNGDVFGVMPYNYYTANYGTILANSFYIGNILYPEEFQGVDPEQEADDIYEVLLGEGVYDEMKNTFGGYKRIEVS